MLCFTTSANRSERQDVGLHTESECELSERGVATHITATSRHPTGLQPRVPENPVKHPGGERTGGFTGFCQERYRVRPSPGLQHCCDDIW